MRHRTETEIERQKGYRLILIRHGATKANLEHRYLGKTEETLSEEGKQELRRRQEAGRYPRPDRLFISPMLRCRETAELLFPDIPYQCIPEWTEIDFGLFEGKNYRELSGSADYQAWMESGGTLPFPKGESRESFQDRVLQGFDRMRNGLKEERMDFSEKNIAAVVHGGTIMALCSSLGGGEYFDFQVPCGEGYECRFRYDWEIGERQHETFPRTEWKRL